MQSTLRKDNKFVQLIIFIVVIFCSRCSAIPDTVFKIEHDIDRLVTNKQNFQVISQITRRNSTHIAFLKHIDGKKYIVKQRLIVKLSGHMNVIRDVLGSHIARESGVLANAVAFIPCNYAFPGKYSKEFPATLHEVVPGIEVASLPSTMEAFKRDIKQCLRAGQCDVYGLTRDIIKNMAFHPDLCRMVALDTFIANKGRARDNFFYDAATDHYYAIDLASAFDYDAGQYACTLIASMLKDNKCFLSEKELDGLIIYRDTLKQMLDKYSPDAIYKHMVDLAVQSGLMHRARVSKHMENHKTMIKKNYDSCRKLVVLLNTLIRKHYTSVSREGK